YYSHAPVSLPTFVRSIWASGEYWRCPASPPWVRHSTSRGGSAAGREAAARASTRRVGRRLVMAGDSRPPRARALTGEASPLSVPGGAMRGHLAGGRPWALVVLGTALAALAAPAAAQSPTWRRLDL